MKQKIILLILFAAGFMASRANENPAVQYSFEARFGNSIAVTWNKIQEVYVGCFSLKNEHVHAYFYEDGEFLGTGKYIAVAEIAARKKTAIDSKFNGWLIEEAYEFTPIDSAPELFVMIRNLKFTAVIRINERGSIQILQRTRNKSNSDSKNSSGISRGNVNMVSEPMF